MDKLDFLDGQSPAETAAPTPEPPAPAPVEQATPPAEAAGQPRAPDGKFAPKGPEASATPAAEPQAPATPPEAAQQQQPPTDDRYAALEKQVAGLTKALTETRKERRQEPPQTQFRPGEEGYEEEQQQIAHESFIAGRARVQVARGYAVKTHGEELVNQALEWAAGRADNDPAFHRESMSADDPVAFAIEEYEYHQALGKLRDPQARAAFMASLTGQAPTPAAAPVVVAAPPSPSPPPRSLAAVPNAGGAKPGAQPVGPGVAFDNAFKD